MKSLGKREIGLDQFVRKSLKDGWSIQEIEKDVKDTGKHLQQFTVTKLDAQFGKYLEETTTNSIPFSVTWAPKDNSYGQRSGGSQPLEQPEDVHNTIKVTMSKKKVYGMRGGWEQPSTPTDDKTNLLEVLPVSNAEVEVLPAINVEAQELPANNVEKPLSIEERARFTLLDSEGNPLPGRSPMNYEEFKRYKANADRIENVALLLTSIGNVALSAFQAALYWALVSFLVAVINYSAKWLFFLFQQKWDQYKKSK